MATRRFALLYVFAALHATVLQAATPCPQPLDIQPGATLNELAAQYFGSPRYSTSIALATNQRGSEGFKYVANPDDLTGVSRVCIPSKAEARELTRSWEAYDRAVTTARLPRSTDISKGLVTIPAGQPVDVVAWVRKDQADRLKTASGGWIDTAASDTWVTVEPHLRNFCTAFVRTQKANDAKLTQRMEQRLGLSPASSKTAFVRMTLQNPGPDVIFRPCSNPAVDQAACVTGPPANTPPAYQQWFLQQYYSSYGQSLISEFPWTALGYTFDWAPGKASPFERTGESEFVIRKGAPIAIREVVATSDYCK